MYKNDILLIRPGSQKTLYGKLSAFKLTAVEPPLWPALLAGHLRARQYRVLLIDAEVNGWSYSKTAEVVQSEKPLLVAVMVSGSNPSASTMNMIGAHALVNEIRALLPEQKIVLTGLHPSALPEQTLSDEDVDFVCQGEGFHSLPKLIDALGNKATDFQIPGIWYLSNDRILSGGKPSLIKDIDSLAMPAWDLLPMNDYRAHNWHCFDSIDARQPYAVLYTSLGCPFNCSFCCINALFGTNTIRYRSPEKVIEEIDFLVHKYGVRNIKIADEMFALNEKRVGKICNLIIERGYDLNIWAYARVNTVTQPMLSKMKAAGINWLAYGFESGSSRVIKDVSKGFSMDKVQQVVDWTYAAGIYICANYIFGLPEDDYQTMNETLKLMLDINAEWSNIYSAMAFPGSQLYQTAQEQNWNLPHSWEGYSQYNYECLPLQTKYLTAAEVLGFRDYAFHTFFENPGYLNKIRKMFGKGTEDHIRQMTAYRRPRKHTVT